MGDYCYIFLFDNFLFHVQVTVTVYLDFIKLLPYFFPPFVGTFLTLFFSENSHTSEYQYGYF